VAVDRFLVANLLQINGLDEFAPLRKWLQEQRMNALEILEGQKEVETLYRAQGKAQAYKEILELLAKAPTLADKYRG
jgi:hypothetical protein